MLIPHENTSTVPARLQGTLPGIPADMQQVRDFWNDEATRNGLPMCSVINGTRRTNLAARLKENGLERVIFAIVAMSNSPFCVGDNDIGFKADFDFFVQRKSFTRIVEGFYLNLRRQRSYKDVHQERSSGYARDALPDALKRMQDRKNGS